MNHRARTAAAVFAAAFAIAAPAVAAPPVQPGQQGFPHRPVCGPPAHGAARCHAEVVTEPDGVTPLASATYTSGLRPADLQSAYKIPSGLTGATIAIVDAYHLPTAENDLGVYRSQFGLGACTAASGCFRQINEAGGTTPPAIDAGWGQEIALDLDMASAICASCNIVLVEANSASMSDLGAAADTAAAQPGVVAISNSYGGNEFTGENSYDAYYTHPGQTVTVSSGAYSYGVQYPAASPAVMGVGGTSLRTAANARGWTESAWSGAGSGCSAVEPKPSWQTVTTQCARRAVTDVSAVADPNTGVAVYDSTPYSGASGWMVFGGTSAAAPIVAAASALAGHGVGPSNLYTHTSSLFDVTSGSNGRCRRTPVLCAAGTGWDGPTGLGTPNGLGAF